MGQIWVPEIAKKELMKKLHALHAGETNTFALVQDLYYWPWMVQELKLMFWTSPQCKKYRISKPLGPLMLTLDAEYPWQHFSADLAQLGGKHYLVGWPEVAQLRHLDTKAVTNEFESLFLTFGVPNKIRTDGGRHYRSKLKGWCQSWGVTPVTSSPHHHQSNGNTGRS